MIGKARVHPRDLGIDIGGAKLAPPPGSGCVVKITRLGEERVGKIEHFLEILVPRRSRSSWSNMATPAAMLSNVTRNSA